MVTEVQTITIEDLWKKQLNGGEPIRAIDQNIQYKNLLLIGYTASDPLVPQIMAINKETGILEWNIELDIFEWQFLESATIVDNIYIGRNTNSIFGFNLDTKEIAWQVNFDIIGLQSTAVSKLNIASNNKLYANVYYGYSLTPEISQIVEVDPFTGENRIIVETDSSFLYSVPEVWSNENSNEEFLIYNSGLSALIGVTDQTINGISLTNLNSQSFNINVFEEELENGYADRAPIILENKVITESGSKLVCFDLLTKSKLWEYDTGQGYNVWTTTKHIIHDGLLYAMNDIKDVICIDPNSGNLIWHTENEHRDSSENMFLLEKENLLLIVSHHDKSVYFLNTIDGSIVHQENGWETGFHYINDIIYEEGTEVFFTNNAIEAKAFKVSISN